MSKSPTILICAGEVSGDILGAELVRELKKRHKGLKFAGVGGAAMAKAGVNLLGNIDQFNGMGLVEVLSSLPRLARLRTKIVGWAEAHKPALCVLIDNQEFSSRLAAKLAPLGIPCVQYAAPKVWAWRQGRVHKLKRQLAHVLCLFPFEVEFFTRHNLPATYVGHPVAQRMADVEIPSHKHLALALLPGSRKAELAHHWPLFLATWKRLAKLMPHLEGLVAVESEAALARIKALGWDDRLETTVGEGRFAALAGCKAALTKSGTNNLELALLNLPAVVAYRMNALTAAIVRRLVKVPYVSPVNLVAGELVYPEYLQEGATEANLARALYPLLSDPAAAKHQHKLLAKVDKALQVNTSPVVASADILEHYLSHSTVIPD